MVAMLVKSTTRAVKRMLAGIRTSRHPLSERYPTSKCDAVMVNTAVLVTSPPSVKLRASSSLMMGMKGERVPVYRWFEKWATVQAANTASDALVALGTQVTSSV